MNLHAALFKISLYHSFLVQTMSDEFLRKLYKLSDGEYKIIEKYKVGEQVGILNSQTDDIVDELHKIGFIKKIGMTKILITFEGKKEVEESN